MTPISIISNLPPAFIFIIGAMFIPMCKGRLKSAFMLFLPVYAFWVLNGMSEGSHSIVPLLDYQLILGRVDRLSRVFGYIFIIISFISILFALKIDDDLQYVSGFFYAGGALGVTFAGDVFTLYIFWEVMAVASTFLILARRTKKSQAAAFRYIMVHIFGGLCLLAGIVMYVHKTGSTSFGFMELSGIAAYLIFFGIAVNAAIPPLHPWLSDAYPESTVTGAVFLSAFTTKSAVYVMARVFPGAELLIWLGALMTAIPIFYAVLENDIRRVLAYSLINQVGFMMCGIGIGTELAINGTVSHAFCHILYKALLFMSAGAVLHMTGKIRCTDLGGLYKTMPFTCICCMIGAASISAFPLFSGFVSKSMIISAVAENKLVVVWLMLQFASAGVFHHAGIKVPFFMFFGHDSGLRPKEPPFNMMLAMGIAAFLCVFIGIYPEPLYAILPYPVDYIPYTGDHVVGQLQLLMFGALAFCLLILSGYYPPEIRAIHLDTDWFYRKGAKVFYGAADLFLNRINSICDRIFAKNFTAFLGKITTDAPYRITLFFITPFARMRKRRGRKETDVKMDLRDAFITNSVPIGISAVAAAFVLMGLFLLS